MGIFESLTEAMRPANQKRPCYKETWKLNQTHHSATFDDPEYTNSFLDADCTIIVDMNKIDEDCYGTKEITIEQYLREYCESDVDDLGYSWLTINDLEKYSFDKVKDMKVCDGMKIFIDSESF